MAGAEGGENYEGYVSAVINSCVQNGSAYTINASFTFSCAGFSGAKLPYLQISSSSGGTASVEGERYDNDPLVRTFSLTASAGDTISVASGYWDDPSDSGASAYIFSPIIIYTIPSEVVKAETKGATWGATAWGGSYTPAGEDKEIDISGAVSVLKIFSDDIAGRVRVVKVSSKAISGRVRVEKPASKSISGRVMVAGIQETSISGSVYVENPDERVSTAEIIGRVDVLKTSLASISGKVHIQRNDVAEIEGQIRVEKPQTADIAGILRVERTNDVDIIGRVRVRVSTPEKLPTDWDYDRLPEAEDWAGEDKIPEEWDKAPELEPDEWEETEKETDAWEDADNKTPAVWEYPLEDSN